MGVVYLAQDQRLNRNVALKFLPSHIAADSEERMRLQIEAQAAAKLNHPNIAQVYAIEEADGHPFIVLEYVEGSDLKDLLDEEELTGERKLQVARQILKGVAAAHEKGIVHRDIKSRNIMVDHSGAVKIMDFGLARDQATERITRTGSTLGTVAYMAPEQLRGEEANIRSDIWSVGVVLYELFTGELPFNGLHEPAIMYSITEEDPDPLKLKSGQIPPNVEKVILRCLQKNPDERYETVFKALEEIERAAVEEKPEASIEKQGKVAFNTRSLSVGVGLVLVVILALYTFGTGWGNGSEIPDRRYLAVLPIENIGNNPQMQAICDGLAETFSFRLSELEKYEESYWVTPASEIRKENVLSASEANRTFGVNLAISSSIQTVQDSTRLILELIDADNIRRISTRQVVVHSENLSLLELSAVREMIAMLEIDLEPNQEERLQEFIPSDPKAYEFYLKGRANLQDNFTFANLEEAVDRFEQAVLMDPEFALGFAGLGESYWRQYEVTGNTEYVELAEISLERALQINANLAPVQYLLGLLKSGTGNYQESLAHFEEAIDIDPSYTAAYREMAGVFNETGETERALETYREVIRLKPNYTEGYKDLGVFHLSNGNFEEAVIHFQKVVDITPANSKAFSNLGIAYYYQGENEKAKAMYERSLELEPSPLTANNLAGLYFADQMYQEAAEMYEIVLEEFPDRYEIWGNLAAANDFSGDAEGAQQAYGTAIEKAEKQLSVNPNDAVILADIGAYYSDLNQPENARVFIQKALEINDQNLFVRSRAVSVYEKIGERNEALNWITAAMIEDIEMQPELKDLVLDPVYIERKNKLLEQSNN